MPTPHQYIKSIPEPRRGELKQLYGLVTKAVPKLKPYVIETAHGTILGFGESDYETKSGCKGSWFTIGLADRKQGLTLYICSAKDGKYLAEHYESQLPSTKIGKSCITIKKFADLDLKVVNKMVKEAGKLGMCFS